ncbi:MAG: LysM peptidoglycan-binding domain-containing protein [Nocardioides sp.]|uniref:LysM peptidoglycan-binding domain-containing protein n=1 Tax=Nocardioides sp. TaxID=35761 RepID=UPI003F07CEBE
MSAAVISPSYVPQARRAGSTVRLTRRGRLVVFLTALLLALTAALFLAGGAMGTTEAGELPPTEIVVVGTGDTLWGIASDVSGGEAVRDTMREIQELNALDTAVLQAGQKLRVPVEG